jgi:glycosyltransferase involved in cell wall biosynthesis
LGQPSTICSTIPTGIAVPDPSAERPVPEPYLLCPARFIVVKDHPALLHAFALAAESIPHKLVLAGEGPERAEVERLARSLGLTDRVDFIGFVRDLETWLAHADLTVLTSKPGTEAFGGVVVESLALGTPVVTTDSGGPGWVMGESGRGVGVVVPAGDPRTLADAIIACLGRYPEGIPSQRLAEIREVWSPSRFGQRYACLVEAIVDAREWSPSSRS